MIGQQYLLRKVDLMPNEPHSPNWTNTTKVFVAAFVLTLVIIAVWRFQGLLNTLVIAGMIAYILNPLIIWLDRYTPLGRGAAIAIIYPIFALIVLGLLTAAGITVYNQAFGLVTVIQQLAYIEPEQAKQLLSEPIQVGAWVIEPGKFNWDLEQVTQQLFNWLQVLIGQGATLVQVAATTAVSWVGWAILIFVLSIYFAIDLPRFSGQISQAVYQPGYRRDVERLLHEAGRIWHAYLRGQTTLAVIVGTTFALVLYFLGVQYALTLGVLAAILDFFPYIGPAIIVTLSTLVAIVQGENWLGLEPVWFGILVLSAGVIIQQIEGNWLNPRIMGGFLGLHPLLVIVGAIMGGTLAGLLGVMLAAPVIATIKLLGTYAWRKMFDLDPFPQPVEKSPPEEANTVAVSEKPVKVRGRS